MITVTTEDQEQDMTVSTTELATLTILSEADRVIEGRQRFQKLAFLLDEHLGDGRDLYSWRKYDYGPYADSLNTDLSELESKGLVRVIKRQTFGGSTRRTYRLTELGNETVQAIIESTEAAQELADAVSTIVDEHGDTPISNLIKQVREEHYEYWENSVYISR